MGIRELTKLYNLVKLFTELCEIPSPSLKEEKLSQIILEIFQKNSIEAEYDSYRNIISKIPASKGYEKVPSLLLSAHMDVVGGSEEVKIRLSEDGKFIETDKTRTLGADNKAGVAAILDLAINLSRTEIATSAVLPPPHNDVFHGPIEIIFTRDEEMGMTGAHNLDTSKLNSKYAVICDGETLGELDSEGAGFTNVYIKVHGGKGGHSGINIHDKTRINAIKVLCELDSQIPQGVYKDSKKGVITSINAGVISGGAVNTYVAEAVKEVHESGKPIPYKYDAKNILDSINKSSALNIISSDAQIAYSIRSSEPKNEDELLNKIKSLINKTQEKYAGLIKIDMEIKKHLKPFVRSEDNFLTGVIIKAGEKQNLKVTPSSFHAGAETHIFSNEKKNASGEAFIPVIAGLANLENIHSSDEKIDWQSFLVGRKWLENIVYTFAEEASK
jgi:di/tripeptidase